MAEDITLLEIRVPAHSKKRKIAEEETIDTAISTINIERVHISDDTSRQEISEICIPHEQSQRYTNNPRLLPTCIQGN